MIDHSFSQIVWTTILISFLLFFLNILIGLTYNTHSLNSELTEKLGMYFYIKDDAGKKDEIYTNIMKLKDWLEKQWLKVTFSSKEDAFNFLQKRVPNVLENFQKYGIENPLPATLYVIFNNEKEYETLKTTILPYKDIILNIKDIEKGKTLKDQENRILTVLHFTSFITWFWIFLIGILSVIIVTILIFLIRMKFYLFHKHIEVEKLLGATYQQIKQPFIIIITGILLSAFVLTLIWLALLTGSIDGLVNNLFEISLGSILMSHGGTIGLIVLLEIIFLLTVSTITANYFLQRYIQRIA